MMFIRSRMSRTKSNIAAEGQGEQNHAGNRVVKYERGQAISLTQDALIPTWRIPTVEEVGRDRLDKYRSSLHPHLPPKTFTNGLQTLFLVLFDNAVSSYFNTDLARAMAVSDWAITQNVTDVEKYYFLEDALNRHCACWEYLFQHVVYVLGFNEDTMPSKAVLDNLLGSAAYDIEFIPHENGEGMSVEHRPRSRREAIAQMRAIRDRIGQLTVGTRAEQFYRKIESEFSIEGSWLVELRQLLRDSPVVEVQKLRNAVAHSRALSATVYVGGGTPFPGSSINFNARPTKSPDQVLRLLRHAHNRLTDALVVTRRAILMQDVPNKKANAGVQYFVLECKCPQCRRISVVPDIWRSGTSPKMRVRAFCRNCTQDQSPAEIKGRYPVPEIAYNDILREVAAEISARGPDDSPSRAT